MSDATPIGAGVSPFPRTHVELDELAAAFSIEFPDEANLVDEKIRILQDAGVDPGADFVEYQLVQVAVDSDDPEVVAAAQLNHVQVTVAGEAVLIEAGQTYRTRDGRAIWVLDTHPYIERVPAPAGESE